MRAMSVRSGGTDDTTTVTDIEVDFNSLLDDCLNLEVKGGSSGRVVEILSQKRLAIGKDLFATAGTGNGWLRFEAGTQAVRTQLSVGNDVRGMTMVALKGSADRLSVNIGRDLLDSAVKLNDDVLLKTGQSSGGDVIGTSINVGNGASVDFGTGLGSEV